MSAAAVGDPASEKEKRLRENPTFSNCLQPQLGRLTGTSHQVMEADWSSKSVLLWALGWFEVKCRLHHPNAVCSEQTCTGGEEQGERFSSSQRSHSLGRRPAAALTPAVLKWTHSCKVSAAPADSQYTCSFVFVQLQLLRVHCLANKESSFSPVSILV